MNTAFFSVECLVDVWFDTKSRLRQRTHAKGWTLSNSLDFFVSMPTSSLNRLHIARTCKCCSTPVYVCP